MILDIFNLLYKSNFVKLFQEPLENPPSSTEQIEENFFFAQFKYYKRIVRF